MDDVLNYYLLLLVGNNLNLCPAVEASGAAVAPSMAAPSRACASGWPAVAWAVARLPNPNPAAVQ